MEITPDKEKKRKDQYCSYIALFPISIKNKHENGKKKKSEKLRPEQEISVRSCYSKKKGDDGEKARFGHSFRYPVDKQKYEE